MRETGIAEPGKTILFLGRKIANNGSHFDITLGDSYVRNILDEAELSKCNPAPTPGTSATKTTIEDEEILNTEQRRQYRRLVGKLPWLSYTRPDIAKFSIRPALRLSAKDTTPLDINIFVDFDRAGCCETRRSTTGFIIQLLGTTNHFGSRTQTVVALSSEEAKFYAISTGTQEVTLHQELTSCWEC